MQKGAHHAQAPHTKKRYLFSRLAATEVHNFLNLEQVRKRLRRGQEEEKIETLIFTNPH